ncbi:SEC23-interacting [Gossypium arboreum]|uniref:SEC23-interacting n=1 Tax=Gossypium arboreum TaxID=29729 RepID=A0A0B0PBA4_GOSAR|nr:SEC23-interacting [Gossypium arboreum]
MAEAPRGRVTITLGRSGQVVKRSGAASDDSLPVAGTKRSVRDRLGGNIDSSLLNGGQLNNKSVYLSNVLYFLVDDNDDHDNDDDDVAFLLLVAYLTPYLRQRGDGQRASLNGTNMRFCIAISYLSDFSTDCEIANISLFEKKKKDFHIGKDDLRFKLLQKSAFRRVQSDNNQKGMDLRQKLSRLGQPPVNSYETHQQMPDSKERIPEPRDRMPESRETSILGKIPSTRSVDDFPHVTTSSSYSPWTLDHLRQRSPDRAMGASRGLSPPRNVELQRRLVSRTYDDVRTVPYMGKDVADALRPVSTASFVTKSTLPTTSTKPMPPGPPIPSTVPPSNIVQKSSYLVDMTALKQMGENDLKELGIPMGPRKKILLALLPRSKRQP